MELTVHDSTDPLCRDFKQQLRDLLRQEAAQYHALPIAKHATVYICGAHDETAYFIESD